MDVLAEMTKKAELSLIYLTIVERNSSHGQNVLKHIVTQSTVPGPSAHP